MWFCPSHPVASTSMHGNNPGSKITRLSIPSRRILLYSHLEKSFLKEAASSALDPVKLLITVQIQRKQEQGRREGMRKEEADSRSPAHPNDSLGKLFLPQWSLLGINPPFQCCRSPKLQPSWRPSGAASLLPHPSSSSLIPSQKGPLSIRSTEITEEEHMENHQQSSTCSSNSLPSLGN